MLEEEPQSSCGRLGFGGSERPVPPNVKDDRGRRTENGP